MTDYDNTNKGILFEEEARKSLNHPHYTGKLDVEGKEYRIAAWERTTKTGQPILSLAISEPREQREAVTDSGYEQAKAKAQEIKDRVAEVNEDEPIDLDSIPF
jgi:uncharacterized protein (DUF736 family)